MWDGPIATIETLRRVAPAINERSTSASPMGRGRQRWSRGPARLAPGGDRGGDPVIRGGTEANVPRGAIGRGSRVPRQPELHGECTGRGAADGGGVRIHLRGRGPDVPLE